MTIRIQAIKSNLPASNEDIILISEEINAPQKSVAVLQSYVAKIAPLLESQTEDKKKKRKAYVEVGYRNSPNYRQVIFCKII